MRRGLKDAAADVLEQVISHPNLAPTRLMARTGLGYQFLDTLVGCKLVQIEPISQRRGRLQITEKGRTFLQHYRICNELLPC